MYISGVHGTHLIEGNKNYQCILLPFHLKPFADINKLNYNFKFSITFVVLLLKCMRLFLGNGPPVHYGKIMDREICSHISCNTQEDNINHISHQHVLKSDYTLQV